MCVVCLCRVFLSYISGVSPVSLRCLFSVSSVSLSVSGRYDRYPAAWRCSAIITETLRNRYETVAPLPSRHRRSPGSADDSFFRLGPSASCPGVAIGVATVVAIGVPPAQVSFECSDQSQGLVCIPQHTCEREAYIP